MTDLEAKLREKIEKQLEERKKARLETGTSPALRDDELSQQLEKKLTERIQTSRPPVPPPPQSSVPATPAIEVPTDEVESEPVVEETPAPVEETAPPVADQAAPSGAEERAAPVQEETVAPSAATETAASQAPAVGTKEQADVQSKIPEVTPEVPEIPEVPELPEVPEQQKATGEPAAHTPETASDATVEKASAPDEPRVESMPSADDGAKDESSEAPEPKTPDATDDSKETKPAPPPPPADVNAKKKTGTRTKAPATDGKRRTVTNKKTRMGTKGSTTVGKTRGPASNRTLSDQEKKLLDEKTRIDEKFKKQKMIAYIAISGGTILLLIVMIVAVKIIQNKRKAPSTPRVVRQESPAKSPGSDKGQPAKPEFASMDELRGAVDRMINVENNTSGAVKAILAYAESTPADATQCEDLVENIAKEYLASGKASLLWSDMHTQLTLGSTSSNPDDVAKAIAALRRFAYRNSKEAFLADYMIQKFEKRYATLTGGLLP